MMKKIIKLSASVLATVILSLACGHGTAAMNRAAAVSVFSPNNSTLPMCTSTVSGMTGFNSASKAATSSSSPLAMNNSSSMAGLVYASGDSGNSTANNSGKSDNGSGTVTRSGDSGKTNGGSGAAAAPKGSGSPGNKGTETPAAPAKPSDGTPAPAPKAPAAPTVTPYNISADQQAIIAYGRSKGLTYNPSLRPDKNTTWSGYDDLLVDVASDNDIIKSGKDDINGMLRAEYAGADFNPYFEKKSNKTNNYYFYVLWG